MVVNSHRALILLYVSKNAYLSLDLSLRAAAHLLWSRLCHRTCITLVMPLINSLSQQNLTAGELASFLQSSNIEADMNDCSYLESSVNAWLTIATQSQPEAMLRKIDSTYVLWAQLLPVRCPFQERKPGGVITSCVNNTSLLEGAPGACQLWDMPVQASEATEQYFADELDLRVGTISVITNVLASDPRFNVTVIFNEDPTVSLV